MSQYFIYTDQVVRGPFGLENMALMYSDGRIDDNTPVSLGRGTPWKTVADHTEIQTAVQKLRQTSSEKTVDTKQAQDFVFYCSKCNQKYRGNHSWRGRDIVCTYCGEIFTDVDKDSAAAEPEITTETVSTDWSSGSGNVICPHCWYRFCSEDILYIAAHPSLMGDPVLGPGAMKRFAPVKFNAIGQALDDMNQVTSQTACPRCRLKIPLTVLDEPTYYFSLVGAPASGKSYYLATLLHTLRSYMPNKFGTTLLDVDPEMNQVPGSYEEVLFHSSRRQEVAVLPKTQQTGDDFVNVVELDNVPVHLPKPFIYELIQRKGSSGHQNCNIIFYDNAGEQFQPGADNMVNPGTRHLACSNGIIFVFDPVNDANMRELCNPDEPQLKSNAYIYDQTRLLSEMIARIRQHRNMDSRSKCDTPLVLAVAKYDVWKNHFPLDLNTIDLFRATPGSSSGSWDKNRMLDISLMLREFLLKYAPGLLSAAEAFFEQVYIVPFSSFGCLAQTSTSGQLGVIPDQIKPVWAAEPFMALLADNGLIDTSSPRPGTVQLHGEFSGGDIIFTHPATRQTVRVPDFYAGAVITFDHQEYQLPVIYSRKSAVSKDDLWG